MDTQVGNNPVKHWGWIILAGILLLFIGGLAVATPFVATITSIAIFGWLLVFAGISQLVFTFAYRESSNFFMYALISILTILIGALMIANPGETAITITLLLAVFFLVAGCTRIYGALALRFSQWGWTLVGGILSVILGILILLHWPSSALWIIGLFIGIELIFTGWSFIWAAIVLKKVA